jgi:hypothetical protein
MGLACCFDKLRSCGHDQSYAKDDQAKIASACQPSPPRSFQDLGQTRCHLLDDARGGSGRVCLGFPCRALAARNDCRSRFPHWPRRWADRRLTTRPLAACEFLVRYANHRIERTEELCRYRARPLCPQKDPLDRSFQTARSFGDGDDGSGGDIAIPTRASITRTSANNPASVGGKFLPKIGMT